MLDVYGDSCEHVLEILAVVFISSLISSVCGFCLFKRNRASSCSYLGFFCLFLCLLLLVRLVCLCVCL